MFLGRVKGHVVASVKDASVKGLKLLVVEPLKIDYDDAEQAGTDGGGRFGVTGRAIVALDTIGAGEGELVLIVQGSSARMADGFKSVPVDAAVIGIVDEAIVMGKKLPV